MSQGSRKHIQDMDRDELLAHIGNFTGLALDLAQHLCFTLDALKDEYKEQAYRQACEMAYELALNAYESDAINEESFADIVVFGGDKQLFEHQRLSRNDFYEKYIKPTFAQEQP